MTPHRLRALIGAALLCVLYAVPAPAETCAATETARPAKSRNKNVGLGALLKAAKNAGVGDLLATGSVLGTGKTAKVAGAVAGTAAAGSEGAGTSVASAVVGLAGSDRAVQIAGAMTGTAAELARAGSPPATGEDGAAPCMSAKAATAPATPPWN